MYSIMGMPVYANNSLCERKLIKMCRSKRDRVRNKWLKNERNYHMVPDHHIYVVDRSIHCHPSMLGDLMKSIKDQTISHGGILYGH